MNTLNRLNPVNSISLNELITEIDYADYFANMFFRSAGISNTEDLLEYLEETDEITMLAICYRACIGMLTDMQKTENKS
jgi:hypothetical protein